MAKGRVQPNNKAQDDKFNYRLNRDIRVPRIRLVGDNLEEVSVVAGKEIETGIYYTNQAIDWAIKNLSTTVKRKIRS